MLPAGAVHRASLGLAVEESSGTQEAEPVVWDGGTLDEVRVDQTPSAEGAEQHGALSAAHTHHDAWGAKLDAILAAAAAGTRSQETTSEAEKRGQYGSQEPAVRRVTSRGSP